jgi:hypothetical protein
VAQYLLGHSYPSLRWFVFEQSNELCFELIYVSIVEISA